MNDMDMEALRADMQSFRKEHFRLDKRIPVALFVTILVQTIGVIWFLSASLASMDTRLQTIESTRFTQVQGAELKAHVQRNREEFLALEQRTIRSMDEIKGILIRIEDRMDQHSKDHQRNNER